MPQTPTISRRVSNSLNGLGSSAFFSGTITEILFLLLFPFAAFLILHFEPIRQNLTLDPYIYTGYINNFYDLFHRYGVTYYGVRFGLILPARLFTGLFGPEAGYVALRYLLALVFGVPLYVVIKRHLSAPVAVLVYIVALSNPYVARALLWDHPDASGMPFLCAAICLILLKGPTWKWDLLAGACAGMAANSNLFTVAVFGIFVMAYGSLYLADRKSLRRLACRIAAIAAGALLVTIAGGIYYWLALGYRDIFSVTLNMARQLSQGGMTRWRLSGGGWTVRQFHVYVPVWLSLCTLAVHGYRRRQLPAAVMSWYGVAITCFYYVHQFILRADTLQLFYYLSYAAPAVFLMIAVLFQWLWERTGWKAVWFVSVGGAAMIVPWIVYSYSGRWPLSPDLKRFLEIAASTLALILLSMCLRRRSASRAAAGAAVVLLGAGFYCGFSTYPEMIHPRGNTDHSELDVYRVALQLIHAVPPYRTSGGHILFWYNNRIGNSINSLQSTYLWAYSKLNPDPALGPGLPALNAAQISRIKQADVRYLGLLCESRDELSAGLRTLAEDQIPYHEAAQQTLASGNYRVYWELLDMRRE